MPGSGGRRGARARSSGSLPYPGSGRKRVAPLDGRPDQGPALLRRKARAFFHARRRRGEGLVLDGLAEPTGIVLEAEMVEPRLVIDSRGQLHEEGEVPGPQVQPPGGAAEVEALVLSQLARGVLAHVTPMLRLGRRRAKPHGIAGLGLSRPQERLSRLLGAGEPEGRLGAHDLAEGSERVVGRLPDGDHYVDG